MHRITLSILFLCFLTTTLHATPPVSGKPSPIELYRDVLRRADAIQPQLAGMDQSQREQLLEKVVDHPVAGLASLDRYDPSGVIGFCFGRAMCAHLVARKMGLVASSVRKLFIVGDLRQAGATTTEWRFHVTTVVNGAGPDIGLQAIDPIMSRVMPVRDWMHEVQRTWDLRRKAKFYLVPTSSVLPDLTMVPDPGQETGERLIEISFKPEGRPGFARRVDMGPAVYELLPDAARTFMMEVDEPERAFDFERLAINGYFLDLLTDLSGARPVGGMLSAATSWCAPGRRTRIPVMGLGSPDFARLLHGGKKNEPRD